MRVLRLIAKKRRVGRVGMLSWKLLGMLELIVDDSFWMIKHINE